MSAEVKGLGLEQAPEGDMITLLAAVEQTGAHKGEERGYELERKSATLSGLVATTLETSPDATEIDVPRVDYQTLGYLVEYLDLHKGVKPSETEGPVEETDIKNVKTADGKAIAPEDIDLINRVAQAGDIYEFLKAASYMDIPSAMDLARAKIVSVMKNGAVKDVVDRIASLAGSEAEKKAVYAAAEQAAAEAKDASSATAAPAAEVKRAASPPRAGVAAATAGMAGLGMGEQKRTASPPRATVARAASPVRTVETKRAASPPRATVARAASPPRGAGAGTVRRTMPPPPPPARTAGRR